MVANDYEAAERSYLRTLELKPAHGLARFNLGYCQLKQGHKALALASFRDAVRYRPELAVAQLELGGAVIGGRTGEGGHRTSRTGGAPGQQEPAGPRVTGPGAEEG